MAKNKWIVLGNGLKINADLVKEIRDNGEIELYNGEIYIKYEFPDNDNHDYLDNLYDTKRKVNRFGKEK